MAKQDRMGWSKTTKQVVIAVVTLIGIIGPVVGLTMFVSKADNKAQQACNLSESNGSRLNVVEQQRNLDMLKIQEQISQLNTKVEKSFADIKGDIKVLLERTKRP